MSRGRSLLFGLVAVALYALHQDFWNWQNPTRVLGLPIGFAYHVAFCFLVTGFLVALTRDMSDDGGEGGS